MEAIRPDQLIYSDSDIVVVNKDADQLSVPGRGEDKQDCLWRRVQQSHPTARIVHRLDFATSGIMVLGLNAESHRHLSIQFQERQTAKRYLAIIAGQPSASAGIVDQPLRCDWENRPLQIIDHEQGKQAETHWQILHRFQDRCLVELIPITGRSHQLRVHMQYLGHPILGDRFYANEAQIACSSRLLLHAESLSFSHPVSGKALQFTCPAPFNSGPV